MSRSTPRKSRHRQNASGGAAVGGPSGGGGTGAVTDYESDAAYYMENRPGGPSAPAAPTYRTNTELNLSVLKRYVPSIRSIASMANQAVVYVCDPATGTWDKPGIEGPMFVCEREPLMAQLADDGRTVTTPRACIVVMNRLSLENAVVDLARLTELEASPELLVLSLRAEEDEAPEGGSWSSDKTILGLYMHEAEADTREKNSNVIRRLWNEVQSPQVNDARSSTANVVAGADGIPRSYSPTMQALGRKVSISDLFGRSRNTGVENGS